MKTQIIRVFEACSGYGAQHLALKTLSKLYPFFKFKVVGVSEIDQNAINGYRALHGKKISNWGDITKIEWEKIPDFDCMVLSSPCTTLSLTGNRTGFKEGSGTESSLLWEGLKGVEIKRPKFLIIENVKNILCEGFREDFNELLSRLEGMGYNYSFKILDARNFGIPQHRERFFLIAILKEDESPVAFQIPEGTTKRMEVNEYLTKKIFEKNIPEEYYLKDRSFKKEIHNTPVTTVENIIEFHGLTFNGTTSEEIQATLKTISYKGKDPNFRENPDNHNLFRLLLTLYSMSQEYYKTLTVINLYGTLNCGEISKRIQKVVNDLGKYALLGKRRKKVDPDFNYIDFSLLLNLRQGKLTGNIQKDYDFWKKASEQISITTGDETIKFRMISIFEVIRRIERQLHIKGEYKQTFTTKPRGKVIEEGELNYGTCKEMRKLGSELKRKEVKFNLCNKEIIWKNGNLSSDSKLVPQNYGDIFVSITSNNIGRLYGKCHFEVIKDFEGNFLHVYITNAKDKSVCLNGFSPIVSNHENIFIEIFSTDSEETNDDCIRRYDKWQTLIQGVRSINDLDIKIEKSIPYFHLEKDNERRDINPKLIRSMLTTTTQDYCSPTLMANNGKPSWNSIMSLGAHPNFGVIEIWESENKIVDTSISNSLWQLALNSSLLLRKQEDINVWDPKEFTQYTRRKISNSQIPNILRVISDLKSNQYIRVRAMTPKEKFRLMGLKDRDIDKLLNTGICKTQLYKMAGNSIVINVLIEIFKQMFISQEKDASAIKHNYLKKVA